MGAVLLLLACSAPPAAELGGHCRHIPGFSAYGVCFKASGVERIAAQLVEKLVVSRLACAHMAYWLAPMHVLVVDKHLPLHEWCHDA